MYKKYFFNVCVIVSIVLNLPIISMKKGEFEKGTWQILPGELQSKIITYLPTKKERLSAKLINKSTFNWARSSSLEDTTQALKMFFLYPHLSEVQLLAQEKDDFYGSLKRNWEPSTDSKDVVNHLLSYEPTRKFFYANILENLLTPYFYSDVCLSLFSLEHESKEIKLSEESLFSIPIKMIKLRSSQQKYKIEDSIDLVYLVQISIETVASPEFSPLLERMREDLVNIFNNSSIKNIRLILDTKDKKLPSNLMIYMIDSFNELCTQKLKEEDKEKIKIFDITSLLILTKFKYKFYETKRKEEENIELLLTRLITLYSKTLIFIPAFFLYYIVLKKEEHVSRFIPKPDYLQSFKGNLPDEVIDYCKENFIFDKYNIALDMLNKVRDVGLKTFPIALYCHPFLKIFCKNQFVIETLFPLIEDYVKNKNKKDLFEYQVNKQKKIDNSIKEYGLKYDLKNYRNSDGNNLLTLCYFLPSIYPASCKTIKLLHKFSGIDMGSLNKNNENFMMVILREVVLHIRSRLKMEKIDEFNSKELDNLICTLDYFFQQGEALFRSVLSDRTPAYEDDESVFDRDSTFLSSIISLLNEYQIFNNLKNIILRQYPFLEK